MGFWSTLGKLASPVTKVLGYAGVPGMSALGDVLSGAGSVLGGVASGAGQGRLQEGMLTNQQNQTALQAWQAQEAAKQAAARMALDAPQIYARQGFLGNLLAHDQSNGLSPTPHPRATTMAFGGMNPADFGPALRAQGTSLMGSALKGQQAGRPYTPGALPQMIGMPQAGFWSKLAGGLGTGLSLGGAVLGGLPAKSGDYSKAASQIGTGWNPNAPSGGYDPFAPTDPFDLLPRSPFLSGRK